MITILGASGFIGRHLVQRLAAAGNDYYAPSREADLTKQPLGDVIYCIGLTADFRKRPFDTIDAHVTKLAHLLKECEFDSLLYLSTTRVYKPLGVAVNEDSAIMSNPQDPNDLYNISKIMGESLALSSGRLVRVARLSNVFGADWLSQNFLFSLIKDALSSSHIHLRTALASNKDYISVEDVVTCLLKIVQGSQSSVYNVASGVNCSHEAIVTSLQQLTGCRVTVAADAPTVTFPQIEIERLRNEFNFQPKLLLDGLPDLVSAFEKNRDKWQ
jgi:nucleoside-diphosphate-sugar epimerase